MSPLGLAPVAGCGDGATSGRRVALTTRVAVAATTFTNAAGFDVELTRALVSIGPLRYVEGAPFARRPLLERLVAIRTAHAHPGHYHEGGVLGEMLTPTSVDLGALGEEALELGAGTGITGTALSARFTFRAPPEGPYADALGEHVVVVEGVATRDGESRSFRATAWAEEVADTDGEPKVLGCPFEHGTIDGDGVVTLTFRPSVWLDQVDFSLVEGGTDGEPSELARGETPHAAFLRGLKKASAYHFAFTPGSGTDG